MPAPPATPGDRTARIWTVGHSTRPIEEFVGLLKAHGIALLVDVRSLPYSRRNPQFNTDRLAQSLKEANISYRHLPSLGGRRKSRPDSPNRGWRSAGFRGYADYMQAVPFQDGLAELMKRAERTRTAVMCAEAVPWRCHRQLIADALVTRGWTVLHILGKEEAAAHSLTPFARLDGNTLTYPAGPSPESGLGLFP